MKEPEKIAIVTLDKMSIDEARAFVSGKWPDGRKYIPRPENQIVVVHKYATKLREAAR